jgi:mono/diheme cytochrome c family protein
LHFRSVTESKLRLKRDILACLSVLILGGVLCAAGQEQTKLANSNASSAVTDSPAGSTSSSTQPVHGGASSRFDGEKRFRANCGRCHTAPHKFPPRMMATIVRHMRVRATITDEDMHLILQYMTE